MGEAEGNFGALIDDRGTVVPSVTERVALVEHDPVYTLGFHGDAGNLPCLPGEIEPAGRGGASASRGEETSHTMVPDSLWFIRCSQHRAEGLGVKKYIELLEGAVTELLKEAYGIESLKRQR